MIRLTPPRLALTPPPAPQSNRQRSVLPVGDAVAVCQAGGMIRIDVAGEVHGGRVVAMLSPADAQRMAMELGLLARRLGA